MGGAKTFLSSDVLDGGIYCAMQKNLAGSGEYSTIVDGSGLKHYLGAEDMPSWQRIFWTLRGKMS